jgi:hypothetical protein
MSTIRNLRADRPRISMKAFKTDWALLRGVYILLRNQGVLTILKQSLRKSLGDKAKTLTSLGFESLSFALKFGKAPLLRMEIPSTLERVRKWSLLLTLSVAVRHGVDANAANLVRQI